MTRADNLGPTNPRRRLIKPSLDHSQTAAIGFDKSGALDGAAENMLGSADRSRGAVVRSALSY